MAELDNLSVVISVQASKAEKAIDKLTASLRGLEKAMNVASLNTFVARLNSLTKAANSLNVQSLKDLAKAMKDLSSASHSLADFGKAANQMGKVSNQAKTMADKLSKEWGIKGSKNVNSLAMAIENMYAAAGNDAEVGKSLSVIERLIKEYARVGAQADETQKKIREMVSASTIYVPPTMRQEWGDDYKSKLGTLGIKNTTSDPTKGVDVQTFASELRGMYGDFIPDTNNVEDTLTRLVEYLQNGSQSVMTYKEAINQGAISTEYLDDSLNTLAESVGTSATNAFNSLSQAIMNGSVAMDDVKNKMNEITSAGASASAFSGVISSLESLQGLTIPDFTNLVTLKESISKIGGEAGSRAGQSLKDIAAGLRSFQGVTIPELPGIGTLTSELRAIGSGTVVNAGKALPDVARGLTMLKDVGSVNINGLDQLAASLSMFGRKSAQDAVVIIPQLSRAFREMIDTLSNAPNISQRVIDLANAMANLSANMKSMPVATQRAGRSLNLWHGHAQRAQKASFNLAAAIGKLYAQYWMFMRVGRWFGSSMKLASDLVEVQNVVDNTFGDMKDKMEDFAKTSVDTLGMSELTVKTIASRFQAMGKNMGVPNEAIQSTNKFLQAATKMGDGSGRAYSGVAESMADVSLNLTKLTGDMASFYNLDYNDVAKKLEAVFTGQTRPLRTFGLDLTQATLKEFALRNGLNANIKTMSQYEKMLLRYQYVMANTTAAHGDFERTINTWANQIRIAQERLIQLKKILGTIGVNVFKPLVRGFNDAMNTIIHLAESTLNALGKIFGWKVEIADVGTLADDTEDIAENIDDAAGSAKKMKDYMLGIDELNVFNADDGKGGGGASASGGADAAEDALVKWEKTATGYDSIYDTLYKLGEQIGKVQKAWLQGIDWDGLYDKAERFGKGLATFLNGYLKDAELFYEKGGFIAKAINLIAHALKAFSEEFNGYQLGVDIGSWINGFTENLDWATIQKAATEIATDIADAINGAFKTVKWDKVGETIGQGINTAIKFFLTLGTKIQWKKIGEAVSKGVNSAIKTIDFKGAGKALGSWAKGLLDALLTALRKVNWDAIGQGIGDFLVNIDFLGIMGRVARSIWSALQSALTLYSGMFSAAPLETVIVTAFASPVIMTAISNFTTALTNAATGVSKALSNIGGFFSGRIYNSMSDFSKYAIVATTAITEFVVATNSMKNLWSDMDTSFGKSLLDVGTLLGDAAVSTAALTAAMGPVGTVLGVVTSLLGVAKGALEGYTEEMQEAARIAEEEYQQAIYGALAAPRGVELETLTGNAVNSMKEIGNSFEDVSEKIAELDNSHEGLAGISKEIDGMIGAMNIGVTATEEDVNKMLENLQRYIDQSRIILSQEKDILIQEVLVPYAQMVEAQGGTINETLKNLIMVTDGVDEAIATHEQNILNLASSYEAGDISFEAYTEGLLAEYNALNEINGVSTEAAVGEINALGEALDLSQHIKDGVLDTAWLASEFSKVTDAYVSGTDEVSAAYTKEIEYVNELERKARAAGIDAELGEIKTGALAVKDQSIASYDEAFQEYLNIVQTSLMNELPAVMREAERQGLDPTETYQAWITGVAKPAQQALKEAADEAGVNGNIWMGNAINSMNTVITDKGGMLVDNWENYIGEGLRTKVLDSGHVLVEYSQLGEQELDNFGREIHTAGENLEGLGGWLGQTAYAMSPVNDNLALMVASTSDFSNGVASANGILDESYGKLEAESTGLEKVSESSKQLQTDLGQTFTGMQEHLTITDGKFTEFIGNLTKHSTNFSGDITKLLTEMAGNLTTWFTERSGDIEVFGKNVFEGVTTLKGNIEKEVGNMFKDIKTDYETFGIEIGKQNDTIISHVKKALETFMKWYKDNVEKKFTGEYWSKLLGEIPGVFETTFRGVASAIATIMNSLIEQINSSMNVKWDALVVNGKTVMGAGQAKLFEIQPIPMYERGGFPEDGLFYANHNELVGGFNGRTAVANNEQIVGGIREGVQEAMSDVVFNMLNPYLSDIAQSSRTTANKDFTVNLGDRDIAMAANRGQSLVGMSIIS